MLIGFYPAGMTGAAERSGAGSAPDPAEDLAILFPDVDAEVRDPDTGETVTVTVRELQFPESLRAQAEARPFLDAFAATHDGDEFDSDAIAAVLTDHADTWIGLRDRATDRGAGWIGRLSEVDGDRLSAAMWEANRFFRPPPPVPAPAGRRVLLAEVLDALGRAGHGHGHRDIARRLTWRQIQRFREVGEASRAEALIGRVVSAGR